MKAKHKWHCQACQEAHDKEQDAIDCCPPEERWTCASCQEGYDKEDEAQECCIEQPLDVPCLCGAKLYLDDERPSQIIGVEIRCASCREKVIAGVPAGEAVRQSFIERAGL